MTRIYLASEQDMRALIGLADGDSAPHGAKPRDRIRQFARSVGFEPSNQSANSRPKHQPAKPGERP
jgi:hypothetical protein